MGTHSCVETQHEAKQPGPNKRLVSQSSTEITAGKSYAFLLLTVANTPKTNALSPHLGNPALWGL